MDAGAIDIGEFFEVKSMNEWMGETKKVRMPEQLCGELWHEGELAVMFAGIGRGKSVLAAQIAQSIATGSPIEPLAAAAKPRRVLYLDLSLSARQLAVRYSADPSCGDPHEARSRDAGKPSFLKKHYRFSERFQRVKLKADVVEQHFGRPFEEVLPELLRPLIEKWRAQVLIVDDITHLKRTAEGTRESLRLMRELRRLKETLGLSILVLTHTTKRDTAQPLRVHDMQGAKVLAKYADSIFAIGQSRHEAGERYIKHMRSSLGQVFFDTAHVPVFQMKKIAGNYLGFEFQRFAPETDLLRERRDHREWEAIHLVRQLSDQGMTIRAIAEQLDKPKSTVHRYLQIAESVTWPHVENGVAGSDETAEWEDDDEILESGVEPLDFPGSEAYDEMLDDPKFDEMYDDEGDPELIEEYRIINAARARARKEYLKTGTAPPLKSSASSVSLPSSASGNSENSVNSDNSDNLPNSDNPLDRMKVVIDAYGRDRYIEEEYGNGQAKIWYVYTDQGDLMRYDHSLVGHIRTSADPAVFGKYAKIDPKKRQ